MIKNIKKYKEIIIILFLMLITLILCITISNPKHLKFNETSEYIYIQNHKQEIDKIILKAYTMLGEKTYLIDTKEGLDFIENLKIKKEINYTITDSNSSLIFYFNSGHEVIYNFEANNLKYDNKKYEVNNNVISLINDNEIID